MAYQPDKVRQAFSEAYGNRIDSLLAYGSAVRGNFKHGMDLDLFLLLNTRRERDLLKTRQAVSEFNQYFLVDLSLQYSDELPVNPLDFQDGSKGCLALAYLSSADVIAGNNVFADMFEKLDAKSLKLSISQCVTRYGNRITMKAIAHGENAKNHKYAVKYLVRSLLDAMLFYDPADRSIFNDLTGEEVAVLSRQNVSLKEICPAKKLDELGVFEIADAINLLSLQLMRELGISGEE